MYGQDSLYSEFHAALYILRITEALSEYTMLARCPEQPRTQALLGMFWYVKVHCPTKYAINGAQ